MSELRYCEQAVVQRAAVWHFLMERLANPLSQQAGKWLVIPQSAGFASNVSKVQPHNANIKELWDE